MIRFASMLCVALRQNSRGIDVAGSARERGAREAKCVKKLDSERPREDRRRSARRYRTPPLLLDLTGTRARARGARCFGIVSAHECERPVFEPATIVRVCLDALP